MDFRSTLRGLSTREGRRKLITLAGEAGQVARALFSGPGLSRMVSAVAPRGLPPRRGTRELLEAYRTLPWVRSVTWRIARDVSTVPLLLSRPAGRSGEVARSKALVSSGEARLRMMAKAHARGELEHLASHPLLELLQHWNPLLRRAGSLQVLQVYLELKGEAFVIVERDEEGHPCELWPVPPHWCIQTATVEAPAYRFAAGQFQASVPDRDVLWFRNPDPADPYGRGVGIGEALAEEIDLDQALAEHAGSFFHNRALPDVFVTGDFGSDEDAEAFEERLRQKHQGRGKAHQIHVGAGDIRVQVVGQNLREQMLPQLRTLSRDIIVQTFNVPPEIVGILTNSNRATVDAADYLYSRGVIVPRLDFLTDALQVLADEYEGGLLWSYESPVPEDREFTLRAMQAAPSAYTVDEWRELGGRPAAEEGTGTGFYQPFTPATPTVPTPATTNPAPGAEAPAATPEEEDEQELEEGTPPPEVPAEDKPEDEEGKGEAEEDEELEGQEPRARAGQAPRRRGLPEADLSSVLEALRPEALSAPISQLWDEEIEAWGGKVLQTLGVSARFDVRNPLVRADVEEVATLKIGGLVNEQTRSVLRRELEQGIYAGEGIRDLEKRVGRVFAEADKKRARTIARTEVVGSSNRANLAAFRVAGVVGAKEWLTRQDDRVRPEHRALDGAIVLLEQPFRVVKRTGKDKGRVIEVDGPGDRLAGGGMVVNCRCTLLPVTDAEEVPAGAGAAKALSRRAAMSLEARAKAWQAWDSDVRGWEARAEATLRAGFGVQRAEVLERLRAVAY